MKQIISILTFVASLFSVNSFAQNLLPNGDFEQNFTSWTNLVGAPATGVYSVATTNVKQGTKCMKLEITKLGTASYSLQSIHAGWQAQIGKLYKVNFSARSSVDNASLDVVHQNVGFTKNSFSLGTAWEDFEYMYTPTEIDPGFKLQFPNLATYWIDAVTIVEFNAGNIVIPPAGTATLRELASKCKLNIGSVGDQSQTTLYTTTLKNEFNIVVNENALKMASVKSSENGAYNFSGPDQLLAFAQANGMKMRGHCILWHEGMPDWVKNKAWTKATLLAYLKGYITTVAGRYKGKIAEWDVANEFVQNGNDQGNGNILRDGTESVWMKYIGEEVLDSAFKWMRQTDPTAKLYYNDYGAEGMNGKSKGVYELLKRLKARKVPIDGLGFQCHFNYDKLISINSTFAKEMDENIKRVGALGLQMSFTETDFAIPLPADDIKYRIQALSYGNLLTIALNNPTIVKSFLSWGFTDKHSWIPAFKPGEGAALIFYDDYAKKLAYNQMYATLVANCPATPLAVEIEEIQEVTSNNTAVFPNPSNNGIFNLSQIAIWKVASITGKELQSGIGNQINLSEYPKGVYLIKINENIERLVVE